MEAFTELQPLTTGDVVRVPTWTPHALQHGVRVVEFQTQTYERYIVSFAQKVLTQAHWDTERAVAQMHLDPPPEPRFEDVGPGAERIARFDEFNVWRVQLDQTSLTLPTHLPYAIAMAIAPGASINVGPLRLIHEEACFVPRAALQDTLTCTGSGQLLIAAPDL